MTLYLCTSNCINEKKAESNEMQVHVIGRQTQRSTFKQRVSILNSYCCRQHRQQDCSLYKSFENEMRTEKNYNNKKK